MSSSVAASKRDNKPVASDPTLLEKLAAVLPQGYKFGIYHLSTPPTKTEALCSAPPGERPDKTYREYHFLAVTIDTREGVAPKRASPGADEAKDPEPRKPVPVLVFAIEIFIFTTAYQTTFFVSKADSTGYLQLLGLPKGAPSPIREVSSAFLAYLLQHRRRKNIQCVVNLFARAQAQYLFPGSSKNKGKHVLDDWGLVRWWCRVLNPLLEDPKASKFWGGVQGYLMVPGLEETEMRALTPRTAASAENWTIGHPMARISHYTDEFDWVPPRCLIPKYPDDPKSRFRDELDEEASKWQQDMGSWKSVKTLAQFWEMMAFRQECSSGRLTGFVWLVFDPESRPTAIPLPQLTTPNASFGAPLPSGTPATPPRRRVDISAHTPQSSPLKLSIVPTPPRASAEKPAKKKVKKILRGPVIPRRPKIKTQQRNYVDDRPTSTAYYYWPPEGRGDKIVDESDYKRVVELLLHLDFSTLEKATGSTRRWLSEAAMGSRWGHDVTGKRVPSLTFGGVTPIRRKAEFGPSGEGIDIFGGSKASTNNNAGGATAGVNILSTSLVRKKAKTDAAATPGGSEPAVVPEENGAGVKVLGAGLVRKKPKHG